MCVILDADADDVVMATVLAAAPRVALDPPHAWLDIRGLDAAAVYDSLRRQLRRAGSSAGSGAGSIARYGAGSCPIVAQVAANASSPGGLVVVPAGAEAEFLAPWPLADLGVADPLLGWLADVGIERCGDLAAVTREAVEVRFGAVAVEWWRRARGEDGRRLFRPPPPDQPAASVDFMDYVVTDPERLLFTTNALLGGLCEQMRQRGTHARRLRLTLPLANGAVWERTLRTARPTADRAAWLRLARGVLERITVPDSVAGVAVRIESTEPASATQGDLFDVGFATAAAVEGSIARLLEDQGDIIREPAASEHPLAERRGAFRPLNVREATSPNHATSSNHATSPNHATSSDHATSAAPDPVGLTLQLLGEPRAVRVATVRRRDHEAPVRYHDGRWHALVEAAGPDRVSGGQWDETYAREYFRALRDDGTLVWLFHDAVQDRWLLHGWWD